MRGLFLRGTLMWLGLAATAFVLGALRDGLLAPVLGDRAAHITGTLAVCAAFFALIYLLVIRAGSEWTNGQLWLLGAYWLLLTNAFEFLFFHYVMGESWEALLANYNVLEGRLWPLVLATVVFGPRVARALQRR